MKKPLSYRTMFFVVALLLLLNLLPIFFFAERAKFSVFSLLPLTTALLMCIHALLAFLFKHKGNFLMLRRKTFVWIFLHVFSEDKDYTFTEEYESEFRRMLLVYCAAVPFYIPIVAFTTTAPQMLWTLVPLFFPQLVYTVWGIRATLRDVEKDKARRAERDRERREQERREELGHWK